MSLTDLKVLWRESELIYTGRELRPHFVLEQTGVYGSVLYGFVGACEVSNEHLVDQEDRLANDFIRAKKMIHLIAEIYDSTLESSILYQRLLVVIITDELRLAGINEVRRSGDDIFIKNEKLSVSIATVSANSCLIHWGFNFDSEGAPVNAIGFKNLGLSLGKSLELIKKCSELFVSEIQSVKKAQFKVRSV